MLAQAIFITRKPFEGQRENLSREARLPGSKSLQSKLVFFTDLDAQRQDHWLRGTLCRSPKGSLPVLNGQDTIDWHFLGESTHDEWLDISVTVCRGCRPARKCTNDSARTASPPQLLLLHTTTSPIISPAALCRSSYITPSSPREPIMPVTSSASVRDLRPHFQSLAMSLTAGSYINLLRISR